MLRSGRSLPGDQAGLLKRARASVGGGNGSQSCLAAGRLRYTWGDVFLTVVGVLGTLLAMGKANEVADQGGSIVPFWAAYAAGAAVAACWCVFDVGHLQAVLRGRAGGRTRRAAIAMATPGLVIVGVGLVLAFAGAGLQAIVFGVVAGFLLSTMLSYGALVLRERRRSRS